MELIHKGGKMTDDAKLDNNGADEVEPGYEIHEEPTDLKPYGMPGEWQRVWCEPVLRDNAAGNEVKRIHKEAPHATRTEEKQVSGVFHFGQLMNLKAERPKDIVKG